MPNVIVMRNHYPDLGSLKRVLKYAQRSNIGGGYAVDPSYAYQQMVLVKKIYGKMSGVQLKHFVISFSHDEMGLLDLEEVMSLGFEVGSIFQNYQMIYNLHLDSGNVHLHFVMNTVNFNDGSKYSDGIVGFQKIRNWLKHKYPKFSVRLFPSTDYSANNPYTMKDKGVFIDMNF